MLTGRMNAGAAMAACAAVAAFSAFFAAERARAQDSSSVTVDVAKCAELESEAARRYCFGTQVDEILEARGAAASEPDAAGLDGRESAGDSAAASESAAGREQADAQDRAEARERAAAQDQAAARERAAASATPPRDRAERTSARPEAGGQTEAGERTGAGRQREPGGLPDANADVEELFGTIVAVRETQPNTYLITLDNGQVWQQVVPKQYPLQPGQDVRLYPTRWGDSYRLVVIDAHQNFQVRRVK